MSRLVTVIRDKQEKNNYWDFCDTKVCANTIWESLPTGDYTIAGLEDTVIIERKYDAGEFSHNLSSPQFTNELNRMESFKHAFIICEFTLEDLFSFPYNSGIPSKVWPKLRVNSGFLLKRLIEIETQYKVKIIFAADRAKEIAELIFKEMAKRYESRVR